ncbi:MAG: hypothetical protein U0T31_02090 [Chitinophagales bacterium]
MKTGMVIIITTLFFTFSSYAQTQTFDIATFKIPDGWQKSTKPGLVSYTYSNDNDQTFCIITVYANKAAKGNTGEEFTNDWQELAAKPYNIKKAPETEKAEDDGWEVISGGANFTKGSLSGLAYLTTLVGYGKTVSILALTNSESYQKVIEDMLGSLELKKTAPAQNTNNITAINSTGNVSNAGSSFNNTNQLEGIWQGMNINTSDFNYKSSGDPIWLIFYDNGKVGNVLPASFNSNNKNAADLGTYQISGSNASLQWYAGSASTKIIFKKADQIQVVAATGDQNYFRCKSVNGARLEGSWSTYANQNSAVSDGSPSSLITFHKDGTFTDYGIFSQGIDYFSSVKTMPGKGTYFINNFTITLTYSNGAVRQSTFTGFLGSDVNTNNNTIFIDGHKLRKQD